MGMSGMGMREENFTILDSTIEHFLFRNNLFCIYGYGLPKLSGSVGH